jgi:hypothetical protein
VPDLPYPLLVALIVVAVIAGLWVGSRAGDRFEASENDDANKKTVGQRARATATRGAIRLWKWNRERKRDKKTDDA